MVAGTIYGNESDVISLRNTATNGDGAALFRGTNGIAQTGTFDGTTWSNLTDIPGNTVTGGIAVNTDITMP